MKTISNLKKLLKFLNKPLPKHIVFDMEDYRYLPNESLNYTNQSSQITNPDCGTSMCLLGLCTLVPGLEPLDEFFNVLNQMSWSRYSDDTFPDIDRGSRTWYFLFGGDNPNCIFKAKERINKVIKQLEIERVSA